MNKLKDNMDARALCRARQHFHQDHFLVFDAFACLDKAGYIGIDQE